MSVEEDKEKNSRFWLLHAILGDYTRLVLSGGGQGGLNQNGRNGLLAVLCVLGLTFAGHDGFAVVNALKHGAGLHGVFQSVGKNGQTVTMSVQNEIKFSVIIGTVSLLVLVSIIAYWCGLLDRYVEDYD